MEISTSTFKQYQRLHLDGEIDLHNSSVLRETLLSLLGGGQHVLVDFEKLAYIDSSGIAALVESFNVAKKQSLEFKILGASGSPLQVLELTRLVSVFPMVENEASL